MDTKIEYKLRQLVAEYGDAVIEDDRRCAALMMDYCGPPSRFLNVLTMALKTGMPKDLARALGEERSQQVDGWTIRLEEEYGLTADMARWSAETWSFALSSHIKAVVHPKKPVISSPSPETASIKVPTAAVLRVAVTGPADYDSIVDAVAYAPAHSIINVYPGLYFGTLRLKKSVEIIGMGEPGEVVVASMGAVVCMEADNALVRGLAFRVRGIKSAAVECKQGRLVLENCEIECQGPELQNRAACIVVDGGSDPLVRRCRIRGGGSSGVLIRPHGRGQFEDCEVFGCDKSCVEIQRGGDPTFLHCQIHHSVNGSGIYVEQGGRGTFEDCEIYRNKQACVHIKDGGDPVIRRCSIHDSREESGICVSGRGLGTFEDCDVFGSKLHGVEVREGGDPKILRCRIHNSWSEGIYVHRDGHGTFEDCDLFGSGMSCVKIQKGGDPMMRRCKIHDSLEGGGICVSDNGRGKFEECDVFANYTSGVEAFGGGDPVLRRCRIYNCRGDGVYVHQEGRGAFEDCQVFRNEGVCVRVRGGGDPSMRRCLIHDSWNNAVCVDLDGRGTFEDCEIFRAKRSCVEVGEGGDPVVRRCNIHDSISSSGICVYENGRGTFEDCDVSKNHRDGIEVRAGGDPTMRRCKSHDSVHGSGLRVSSGGRGTFKDCDVFANPERDWNIAADSAVKRDPE